ncbi:DUF2935 domain-containing protein [Desulfosporosinus nitroreducens]|uniref:DUF2935 domain-containing protein n=1 Tax=Desulfosporosinus nitroreducens TaxID=2018668 RepID=UPI003459B0D5
MKNPQLHSDNYYIQGVNLYAGSFCLLYFQGRFFLNQRAIALTQELIQFKTRILNQMLTCTSFTFNFPLLIDHIRREAIFFVKQLQRLQRRE